MKARFISVLCQLRRVVVRHGDGGLSDGQLLQRFASQRDEAAFEVLVWRHGSMVLNVGQRVLHNLDDAEDVLQATFLALVRQARSISRGGALASWLYKVAYRTAVRARQQREKRLLTQVALEEVAAPPPAADDLGLLDEELQRLPEKYRTPLILSYLQDLTNQEIATQLACPIGTVFTRLARGRELLRKRLIRRGVTLSAGFLGTALAQAALRASMVQATVKAALVYAAGSVPFAAIVSPTVAALTEGVGKMFWIGRLKFVGITLLLLVVVGSGAGLFLLQGNAREQENGPSLDLVDTPPKPAVPAEVPDRPVVVKVSPADGATEVESVTEIRIRFDRPMDPASAALDWGLRSEAGYRSRGEMRYAAQTREFILPVQLAPGCKHEVTLNPEGFATTEKDYHGFRSVARVAAKPYRWSFSTKKPVAKAGTPPRATVAPPSDTEVALVTPLEVTFDQPMDPLSYGLAVPESSSLDRRPELLGRAEYDPQRHRFTLLTRLPPNWNGELRLEGFRGKDGVEAKPITVKYRTLRTILSEATRKGVEQGGQSAELRQIIERVRKARRELKSVAEEAIWTTRFGYRSPDWLQMLETRGTRFQMQGSKFVGVIDSVMRMPFRIGSDGTTCWFRRGNERVNIPAKDVQEKNVLFCDPFDAASTADTERVIGDRKLEYLGETMVRGQRCYRVRSWALTLSTPDFLSQVPEWSIDMTTLLPLRVEMAGSGTYTIDYTHTHVNKPIPEEEFKPEAGPGIRAVEPEPLTEGYTRRTLNVIDGSNGRMSVRWGMKGPKGTSSSGLN